MKKYDWSPTEKDDGCAVVSAITRDGYLFHLPNILDRNYEVHVLILYCLILYSVRRVEDTKGVIRIRKSKDRQHNCQKKKDKMTNNDLQNIHKKIKIE